MGQLKNFDFVINMSLLFWFGDYSKWKKIVLMNNQHVIFVNQCNLMNGSEMLNKMMFVHETMSTHDASKLRSFSALDPPMLEQGFFPFVNFATFFAWKFLRVSSFHWLPSMLWRYLLVTQHKFRNCKRQEFLNG